MRTDQIMSSRSLRGCITESLRQRQMIPDFESVLLTDDRRQARVRDEGVLWDYKEYIDLNDPLEIAEFDKYVLGFYNTEGGVIIIGIKNNYVFSTVGVSYSKIIDTVKVLAKLRQYVGSDVTIFQDRIELKHSGQAIWLIFVPAKRDVPIPVAKNGPDYKGGSIIKKGTYYVRVNDETKPCIDPSDFARLFSGTSLKHLHAYIYEIDETYYRLLNPHCEHFIGRKSLIQEVHRNLKLRHPIICLDGVGGVGKTAIAIELVRQLYKAQEYQFIISLSAKNRIWYGYSGARQAGFTGFTELLTEIAKVLGIEIHNDTEILKKDVINFMTGIEGLLLIDNLEAITDTAIFRFLSEEIPIPVKVLVTSRIDRALGAKTISVPAMDENEALDLLHFELDRVGYHTYLNEPDEIHQILRATGRLPLALKWAASLAQQYTSLREVSHRLRNADTTKYEFLDFCFSTMYDALSPIARDTATLCHYLGNEWNSLTISIALGRPLAEINEAIKELETRGIILAAIPGSDEAFSVLPLTMDFLANKWNENSSLRNEVESRMRDAFAQDEYKGDMFGWPVEKRVEVLHSLALKLENSRQFDKALQLTQLALQWSSKNAKLKSFLPTLYFLEGRIIYKQRGKRSEGISRMENALNQVDPNILSRNFANECLFLAEAILDYGRRSEEVHALNLIVEAISHSNQVNQVLLKRFCRIAIKGEKKELMSKLFRQIKQPNHAYWVIEEIWAYLDNRQLVFEWDHISVSDVLRLAAKFEEIDSEQKAKYREKAKSFVSHP